MNIWIFVAVYFVLGFIAQLVTHFDMRRCMAKSMSEDFDGMITVEDLTTGEKFQYKSSELDCADKIITNTIEQKLEEAFDGDWKNRPISVILQNFAWFVLWPVMMPTLMLLYRKYTVEVVEDLIVEK